MSTIFAIFLDSPTEESWSRIKERWPEAYIHSNTIAFVPDDVARLTKDISDDAGIGDEQSGIVIQLDYFYGFMDNVLVEWLRKNQK